MSHGTQTTRDATPAAPRLLVLDLDETLIHSAEAPLGRPADFHIAHYHVYRRPHLAEFLDYCFATFTVGVWTSSTMPYAEAVVARIIPPGRTLAFLWARERCTARVRWETREEYWVKNLHKLRRKGYDLATVLAVDDSPEKLERSYGNVIVVCEYLGDPADDELPALARFLDELKDVPNVRTVEKRGWRRRGA